MHYYQFNIGDYRRDTGHLSLLEHGIYRTLLDSYYLNETPLCEDDAILMRTHCIRTDIEEKAFKNVLNDFFILTKKGYAHKKCTEQIKKYNAKSEKARLSAKVRWDAKAMRTHSEGNANHKPLTINHKPIKRKAFAKPTQDQLRCFANVKDLNIEGFYDYYESNGWRIGKNPMKDWAAAARNWSRRQGNYGAKQNEPDFDDTNTNWAVDMANKVF